MGKRYLYTIQIDSETPEQIFYNVDDIVDYLNKDVDVYTSYMINNYFLQRNKKTSKLISRLYKFTRVPNDYLLEVAKKIPTTNLPSPHTDTVEL